MKITYDMKLSSLFSGGIEYVKHDYINDIDITYNLLFTRGELIVVSYSFYRQGHNGEKSFVHKRLDEKKWNEKFWAKAPKRLCFDDCNWERSRIYFTPADNSENLFYYSCGVVSCCI